MTLSGWITTTLGEVLPLAYGKGLPKKSRTFGTVPVYGSSGVVGKHAAPLTSGPTLVVGRKGNVGEAHLSTVPCWPIDTVYFTEGGPSTDLRFFYYLLRFRDLRTLDRSTAVPGLSRDDYDRVEIVLPPQPEQQRIVDAIESYLTRLDDAVASIERIRAKLKAYRASVLKAAVDGRLVSSEASLARAEKREYEPAEVLLARILKERRLRWEEGELAKLKRAGKAPSNEKWKAKYEQPIAPDTSGLPVLPEGWCWATIDQVAEDTMIGLVRNRQQQRKGPPGYAYLKMDAIGLNGSLRMDQFVYVDADKADAERYALRANDILFNTRNSIELVGKTALVPGGANGRLFNNNIMRIRVCNGLAPAFIALQMSSLPFRARLEKIKRATTNVAAIYGKDLFPQVLAIPPAAEQERITEIVASLLSTQEAVNETIVSQLKRVARLRQSVLKWAFEGKCVDQDPSDEPAEKLLARIRADRAVIAPSMERRARTARGAA